MSGEAKGAVQSRDGGRTMQNAKVDEQWARVCLTRITRAQTLLTDGLCSVQRALCSVHMHVVCEAKAEVRGYCAYRGSTCPPVL